MKRVPLIGGPIAAFALASLLAVASGCFIMALNGEPAQSWLRNIVAWAVGGIAAALLHRLRRTMWTDTAIVLIAIAGLAATFGAPDQQGVHRWIDLGPLQINMAAILLPLAMVALAGAPAKATTTLAGLVIGILLILQPDASQMTGAAFGMIAILLVSRPPGTARSIAMVFLLALGAAAWARPDPLQPVAIVERILALGWDVSPMLAIVAVAALASASLAPLLARTGENDDVRPYALAAYCVGINLAILAGWFPVPLVGLGMSFPIGWWLAMGYLCSGRARIS